jgi:hypothetical protein
MGGQYVQGLFSEAVMGCATGKVGWPNKSYRIACSHGLGNLIFTVLLVLFLSLRFALLPGE